MRRWVAVVAGVLVLTGGCVSRTGEPTAAGPTTTTSTTTTSRPTTLTADPLIGTEAASILSNGDAERFNQRICPGTPHIKPVSAIGSDYAHTMPTTVDNDYLPVEGDTVVVRLSVQAGRDLVLVLGLNYNTYEWCAYSFTWCPIGTTGLAPFTIAQPRGRNALDDLSRTLLCGR